MSESCKSRGSESGELFVRNNSCVGERSCSNFRGDLKIGSTSCLGVDSCAGIVEGTIGEDACVGVSTCSLPMHLGSPDSTLTVSYQTPVWVVLHHATI